MRAFREKHRWEAKNHLLTGITICPLLSIFRRHYNSIDWIYYSPRLVFLIVFSAFNTLVGIVEKWIYDGAIRAQPIHPEPVFIIGHPRTGTTHIHNLLARSGSFAFCNTFQAGFPSTFLLLERFSSLLEPVMDKTRPMDNMKLSFDLPQEDEVATNLLSGGISPYMQICIMKEFSQFQPYFTFDEDTCPPEETRKWVESFLYFMKKVTLKHGFKPLLIKSPVHTARVKLFLKLFPKARFVYMHRDPYEVLQSASHMADTYYWYCYLHKPTQSQVEEFIYKQYELLYDRYVEDRDHHLSDRNLFELGFSDLNRDPEQALCAIYRKFNLGDEAEMRDKVKRYMESLADFRKNDHAHLDEEDIRKVNARWGASFAQFGYDKIL